MSKKVRDALLERYERAAGYGSVPIEGAHEVYPGDPLSHSFPILLDPVWEADVSVSALR